ncbi:polyphosphate kinase 1 [Granulicella tundricola]|uniref:Polyphosphate kinase n=1 Tax=Granulicella tundricola (strain ATCC BAA-1859 / DSM 23138 / MP5ACTX9) TaxID=1198114 RepID=E8X2F9_GRATM|nr:polyphosphate kinase 1 [Granulicella tundricola]ADW69183.1 Polyphosphate kinase [Granulicella tundricola MP5ACTX9]
MTSKRTKSQQSHEPDAAQELAPVEMTPTNMATEAALAGSEEDGVDLAPKSSAAAKRAVKSAAKQISAGKGGAKRAGKKAAETPVESRYFNRDESWLRFNQRVLEEAQDEKNPLLERVKFLAITASNLDEFVEIRVAGVLQRIEDGLGLTQGADEGGLTQEERLARVSGQMAAFVAAQYRCWNEQLLPSLKAAGVHVLRWGKLSPEARTHALKFYEDEVDPLLTPVTIDPSHPFPRVLNKALCIALLLRHKRRGPAGLRPGKVLGVVTVPRSLPRLVCLPSPEGRQDFIFLHELIESQVEKMFRGYEVLGKAAFRVTRNSNLYMQEEESRSVLESVRAELHNRRKGDAVRLEIETSAAEEIVDGLRTNFELDEQQVFKTDGPVNLSRLMNLYSEAKLPGLKYPAFSGKQYKLSGKNEDLFAELREKDVMLHHPFDSYRTVEEFIGAGARDERVISMKQTLYRTSKDSPIFRALIEAAQSKDVTVVVELMARFDEDSNIRWARELEDAGVGVFHGIFGLKTHCKLALLVRRDADGHVRRYAHLGTGNYNPVTARFYTDISLQTSKPEMTVAVQKVFNYLTAESEAEADAYQPLLVAPLTLSTDLIRLIGREADHAKAGRPARIVAKMNGLLDGKTVEALYAASEAGVEVELIVRGMCSLRPGVKGMSERIKVRSIVGQYLEHSRIFEFANGGKAEVYCGSADWMPRNLYERCEVVFPVTEPALAKRLREEILGAYLRDNVKARMLLASGEYVRAEAKGERFSAQEYFMGLAC